MSTKPNGKRRVFFFSFLAAAAWLIFYPYVFYPTHPSSTKLMLFAARPPDTNCSKYLSRVALLSCTVAYVKMYAMYSQSLVNKRIMS